MKLHFLGTTGYHANDSRQTACLMLPELGVILDAGTGLYRAGKLVQTEQLHIFLTHTHLDHVVGLTFFYSVFAEQNIKIVIHMDGRKIDTIKERLFHPDLFPVRPDFEFVPFDDRAVELGDGSLLTTIPLEHPGGSFGFRIDWPDRSFAYITDTMATLDSDYVRKIEGVNTLVHECYFPDGYEDTCKLTGHSCLTPVAQVAAKAGVGKVYLVHVNPIEEIGSIIDCNSVKPIFENMEIAADHQVIDI